MTSNGLFYKKEGNIFSSFRRRGLLPFDWIWKCIIITEKALLPFLLAGEEIYILCYFTSRETESRPGALRSWLTLDGCELFGAEEIKYPSFWSLWPQQSIFVVEFFSGLLVLVSVSTFLLLMWLMFCLNRLRPWQVPHEMINPLW